MRPPQSAQDISADPGRGGGQEDAMHILKAKAVETGGKLPGIWNLKAAVQCWFNYPLFYFRDKVQRLNCEVKSCPCILILVASEDFHKQVAGGGDRILDT